MDIIIRPAETSDFDSVVHILNQVLTYQVDQIRTVLPDQTQDLAVSPEGDYVTLLTCTPYGINTHRLLVRGSRVEEGLVKADKESVPVSPEKGRNPLILAAAGLAVVSGIVFLRRKRRKKQ